LLKLNGDRGDDRGPGAAPQAKQHSHEIVEQLLGLARAILLWHHRGRNVIDDIVVSRRKTP
jgi:hypothetical protein